MMSACVLWCGFVDECTADNGGIGISVEISGMVELGGLMSHKGMMHRYAYLGLGWHCDRSGLRCNPDRHITYATSESDFRWALHLQWRSQSGVMMVEAGRCSAC